MNMQADIFFISFKESNCEENWDRVKYLHPMAIRLHGIQGIDKVHNTCDMLCSNEYFWTVDGDNYLTNVLNWDNPINHDLLMFKATDPIHKNLTLLGGVKLWKKGSIINKDMSKGDFSLNATKSKIVLDYSFSETRYNSSPYDAWKTAFRHCVKLMSIIFRSRPNAKNIDSYIEQWKDCINVPALNSNWCYQGYLDAVEYVKVYDNNIEHLNYINDYEWLDCFFKDKHGAS